MENLSNEELLFDRQECFNDIVLCLVAMSHGAAGLEDRLEGNLKMIKKIEAECKKRGFDPAQYQGGS